VAALHHVGSCVTISSCSSRLLAFHIIIVHAVGRISWIGRSLRRMLTRTFVMAQ